MENFNNQTLENLFQVANKIGKRRYHRLTQKDWEDYRKFDYWRYIDGQAKYGTTEASQDWVRANSDWHCPICEEHFFEVGGKTIDHKLPRSQYPWLSLDYRNFWVICRQCNREKGEMYWYEYEHYLLIHYPHRYENIQLFRPRQLLQSLNREQGIGIFNESEKVKLKINGLRD